MATDRFSLRNHTGLRLAKLLGTGSPDSFSPRDANWGQWAVLASWGTPELAAEFQNSPIITGWQKFADESAAFTLTPISSRGRWSGHSPFEPTDRTTVHDDRPVAAITRARVRVSQWAAFHRYAGPVGNQTSQADGLLWATGIGELPVGLQGTFSIWRDHQAMSDFSRSGAHSDAVSATHQRRWYAEELFARLRIDSACGTLSEGIDCAQWVPSHGSSDNPG